MKTTWIVGSKPITTRLLVLSDHGKSGKRRLCIAIKKLGEKAMHTAFPPHQPTFHPHSTFFPLLLNHKENVFAREFNKAEKSVKA
jgi:hypothetical protein